MNDFIPMLDLAREHAPIIEKLNEAIQTVIASNHYIKGPEVQTFEQELSDYLGVKHVISCGNGTDALQLALMSLDLKSGDEVIIPAFTYISVAEVISLLQLTPVFVDVQIDSFAMSLQNIKDATTEKTKVIIPVHLFGQACDMTEIVKFAKQKQIVVIEDNAQSIGSNHIINGEKIKIGTLSDISCTSFFPSKNLGAFGDGGAIITNSDLLAQKIRMLANHGQSSKYNHHYVGCNSRLDTLQAAVLSVKLAQLDKNNLQRQLLAANYDVALKHIDSLDTPVNTKDSNHIYHQYTLRVDPDKRDALKQHLMDNNIASAIYYPLPIYKQEAYKHLAKAELRNSEYLCQSVLSIPIHPALTEEEQDRVIKSITNFLMS